MRYEGDITLNRTAGSRLAILFSVCMLGALATDALAGERFAVKAKRIYSHGGNAVEGGALVIQDGRVVGVFEKAPEGVHTVEHPDAVIIPGMIDMHTQIGVRGSLADLADAVQDDLDAIDAFDPHHPHFADALSAGVTTVVLLPSAQNVVGGLAAAVKTGGPVAKRRIASEQLPVTMSIFGEAVGSVRGRTPTSRMGTYDLFRRTLDEAKSNANSPLGAVAAGQRRAIVHCGDATDLRMLTDEAKRRGIRVAAVFTGEVERSLDDLATLRLPIVFGPLTTNLPVRFLRAPGQLANAGHTLSFAGGTPAPSSDSLRVTAALAARHTTGDRTALAANTLDAITRVPARLAGIEARVGTLAAGKDADFVVLSGDPLDLSSSVLEVWIQGQRVVDAHAHDVKE